MRALVLHGPRTAFELVERPVPSPGLAEALVRVRACGAGLTIHHAKAGRARARWPIVIGHEIAGEVVDVGAHVTDFRAGDRVTPHYYLSCGDCRWCRNGREPLCIRPGGNIGRDIDGGYAEYCVLPARNLVRIPRALPYDERSQEVAIICDAIVTPVKVARKARIAPLETVVVIGAGGGVGIHMVQLAKLHGARVIAVDLSQDKLELASQVGADQVLNAREVPLGEGLRDLAGPGEVDVVVDFVVSPETVEGGLSALGRGGRLVVLGGQGQPPPTVDLGRIRSREIELLGSRYVSKQEIADALDLVAAGLVKPIVTLTAPLEEAEAVHAALEAGTILGRAALVI